jgi:hypothetical protein
MHNCTITGCNATQRDIIFLSSTWFDFTDCSFRSNTAPLGVMLYYESGNGSLPIFVRPIFVGNSGDATVHFRSLVTWECQARFQTRQVAN